MVQTIKQILKNIRFTYWTAPIALLIVAVVTYGLLIPKLGFYWDDWERILVLKLYGPHAFWDYFSTKRPFAAWAYYLISPLLGGNPIGWHIVSLLIRWLAAVSFYQLLLILWPNHRRQALLASLFFLVSPIFLQQSIIVYFKHWLAYLLFFTSLILNLLAVKRPRRYTVFTVAAMSAELLHLSLLEYFTGLELLRPVLIYLVSKNDAMPSGRSLRKAILHWLPYLALLGGYTTWRLSFGASLEDNPYNPELLHRLLSEPFVTLRSLLNIIIQDMIFIFASSWQKTLKPGVINLFIPFSVLAWGIALVMAVAGIFYMTRLTTAEEQQDADRRWFIQAGLGGFLAGLLGALPVWITFRPVSIEGLYTDRFAIPCMAGAALFLVVIIEWLVQRPIRRIVLINFLLMLGISLQLRIANDFRWSWIQQQRIYWQLVWRAPYIQPETVLLTDTALFSYVLPQFSINLLYREPADYGKGGYIFSYLGEFNNEQEGWLNGKDLEIKYLFFDFKANTHNSIILFNEKKTGNCLWVLNMDDSDNPYLPAALRAALPLSNLNRINPTPPPGHTLPEDVFGPEPEHNWCYYYQKADLAQQLGNYRQAADLGDEALSKGYSPSASQSNSPQEWIPFIESYAAVGQWQKAVDLSQASLRVDQNYRAALCGTWQRISHQTQPTSVDQQVVEEMYNFLECNPYLKAEP